MGIFDEYATTVLDWPTGDADKTEMVQDVLEVPAGSTYKVPRGIALIRVGTFRMGQNSVLALEPGSTSLTLEATRTEISEGTWILGLGRDGAGGTNGEEGGPGADLRLRLGEAAIHGLIVSSKGGDGGDGAPGSKGPRGRDAECSGQDATNGGRGGRGGNGGNGGKGGAIYVTVKHGSSPMKLSARTDGGSAGSGGAGGPGGDGGSGKSRCGPWPYWSKGGGAPGPTGQAGSGGADGAKGDYDLQNVS